jgi:hypothetical protein
MRVAWSLIVLGTAAGAAHADAPHLGNALDDLIDPRSMAIGDAGIGLATGEAAIGLNPSGVAFNKELAIEADYGYRLSDSASIVNASACDSTNAVPGCFYYHYTGASPDSTGAESHSGLHVFGTVLSYPVTQNIAIGSGLKYYHFDTDDMNQAAVNNFAWDLGATAKLGSIFSIGGTAYNLTGASVEMPRALGGGVTLRPFSLLTLAFDSRWLMYNGDRAARYGGGANFMITGGSGQTGVPLSVGLYRADSSTLGALDGVPTPGVTYLTGGLGLTTMSFGIDVSAKFSVDGPNDTEILASIRLWPVPRGNL